MLAFFSVVHVVLSIFMIFVILLQPGKDAGMGAALGGGAASSAFGGRGAVTFLTKVTAGSAIAYFVTSMGLSFVGLQQGLMTGKTAPPISAPATPGTPASAQPAGAPAVEKTTGEAPPPPPAQKTPGTEGVPGENAPAPAK